MLRSMLLAAVAINFATASSLQVDPARLLKRQQAGTPAYNCHDNCGQAITASRSADPCKSDVFLTDYKVCLSCSGPDNFDIWKMYGRTLSVAGEKCGLDTKPKDGKQPDPPVAVKAGGNRPDAGNSHESNVSSATAAPSTPVETNAKTHASSAEKQTISAPADTAAPVTSSATTAPGSGSATASAIAPASSGASSAAPTEGSGSPTSPVPPPTLTGASSTICALSLVAALTAVLVVISI